MLTTEQAAERLGVSPRRIRTLIAAERLDAEKQGRDWLVTEASVEAFQRRRAGRPKTTAEKPSE